MPRSSVIEVIKVKEVLLSPQDSLDPKELEELIDSIQKEIPIGMLLSSELFKHRSTAIAIVC